MSNPFAIKGTITVRDSATVMLVRRREGVEVKLSPVECGGEQSPFLKEQSIGIFGAEGVITFDGRWEVLLGQAEVVNWLKTTPEKITTNRYAGEWKLAGGNADDGEAIAHAAVRELQEEFLDPLGISLPQDATLRPFVTKQTRPIRSRSNLMHCFIALEEENPWLRSLDVEGINRGLERRRRKFQKLSLNADGTPTSSFYQLSKAERENVTPEVRQVKWVPLRDAVCHTLSSMTPGTSNTMDCIWTTSTILREYSSQVSSRGQTNEKTTRTINVTIQSRFGVVWSYSSISENLPNGRI